MKDNLLLYILMGALVFSPLSSLITIDVLHLPFCMPEVLLIPFLFFFRSKIQSLSFDGGSFLFYLFFLLGFALLGLLSAPIKAIFSTFRGYLYIIIFYSIFKNGPGSFTIENLFGISIGCILGWLFMSMINLKTAITSIEDYEATYGVMLSIPIFITLAFNCFSKGKVYKLLTVVGLVCVLLICVFAALRRIILCFVISVVAAIVVLLVINPQKIRTVFLSICIFVLIFIPLYTPIRNFVKDNAYIVYLRVFERTEKTLKGEDYSDAGRFETFSIITDNSQEFIFPHGLQDKQAETTGKGIYMDYPLYEIVKSFGFFITAILLLVIFRDFIKCFMSYRYTHSPFAYMSIISMIVCCSFLFVEGTFLYFPYATPITGLIFGITKYTGQEEPACS